MTPVASCAVDRDCGDPDKCVDGTCRDACNVDPCPIGYTGNPRVQCLKSKSGPTTLVLITAQLTHVPVFLTIK